MKHFCLRDATGEDHGVHREFPQQEMRVEEVECENESCPSNASSECTTSAMLIIHPGMNRVKNTGYHITVYIYLINIDRQEIVYFLKIAK